jgi:ketosteroid isomerase-like protein
MTRSKIAITALAAVMAASLSACQKPGPAKPAIDTAKVAEAVKADVAQLVTDFNAKDVTKAVAHDAPGMVGMFHGAPNIVGPEQDMALTKVQVSDPLAKIAVANETVDVASSGDMVVYRATYTYNLTDPKTKAAAVETGNWLLGYKLQPDGIWKIAWNVVSDTPAAAPTK